MTALAHRGLANRISGEALLLVRGEQNGGIHPTLDYWWASVDDAGPPLIQSYPRSPRLGSGEEAPHPVFDIYLQLPIIILMNLLSGLIYSQPSGSS